LCVEQFHYLRVVDLVKPGDDKIDKFDDPHYFALGALT